MGRPGEDLEKTRDPMADPDPSRDPLIATAHAPATDPGALAALATALGPGPFALVILFLSPEADPDIVLQTLDVFGDIPVIGCTTAGEISADGYGEGLIVAVGLPAASFAVDLCVIPDLGRLDPATLGAHLIRSREELSRQYADWKGEFAFLLVDGLSVREDELATVLAAGLGPVPLFGGSAGDGTRFGATHVLARGQVLGNGAVVALIRTSCGVRVFSLDHLLPTRRRMVVTGADPAQRRVTRINAAPAAREYARLLGKDPAQLTPFTFAAHPVVVRIGGRHHVRAIQRMDDNGDLIFFSAIDEGLVLTLAEPQDIAAHLEQGLAALGNPAAILACDCVLRRLESQEKQRYGAVSRLLVRHRVVGFSTYGEQMNAMHVNQTMTGVALYRQGTRP